MKIPALEPYAKKKLEVGVITLTADEALYICEHMGFERQRDVDHRHVGNLTDDMEHDEWVGMSMLLFAHHHRALKLIDSQHRLRAQGEHGRRVGGPVPRRWIVQVVPGDAATAYARLDSRQKKRRSNVIAAALGLDVPGILVHAALDAAACTTRYRTQRDRRVQVGDKEIVVDQPYRDSVEYVEQRRDAFNTLGTVFENLTRDDKSVEHALLRRHVLPICVETIVSRGDDAITFWRAVLSGEGGDRAARYVREKLMQRIPHTGQKAAIIRAMTVAAGWNGHVTGAIYRTRTTTLPVKETDLIIR